MQLHLTSVTLKDQRHGHSDFESLYLVKELSKAIYVTIKHCYESAQFAYIACPCCFTVYSIIDRLPSILRICVLLKKGLGKPR